MRPRDFVTIERWVGWADGTRIGDSVLPLPADFGELRQGCWTYYIACHLYGYTVDNYRTAKGYTLEAETRGARPTARLYKRTAPGSDTFEWVALAIETEEEG